MKNYCLKILIFVTFLVVLNAINWANLSIYARIGSTFPLPVSRRTLNSNITILEHKFPRYFMQKGECNGSNPFPV